MKLPKGIEEAFAKLIAEDKKTSTWTQQELDVILEYGKSVSERTLVKMVNLVGGNNRTQGAVEHKKRLV